MVGTFLSTLNILTNLILTTAQWDRVYNYPHFTNKDTEVQKGEAQELGLEFPQVTLLIIAS